MTSLQGIITILQFVLALLSNPATAKEPVTQALASQAISMATRALAQAQVPVSTSNPTPVVSFQVPTPTNNQPVQSVFPAPEPLSAQTQPASPSCHIVATATGTPANSAILSWTLTGIDPATPGKIAYSNGHNGSKITWYPLGGIVNPVWLTEFYKAEFGGATCFTFFRNTTQAENPIVAGEVSTDTIPAGFTL